MVVSLKVQDTNRIVRLPKMLTRSIRLILCFSWTYVLRNWRACIPQRRSGQLYC